MPTIILNQKEIAFEKKYSSRAKSIRISINSNTLVLTIPKPWFFMTKSSMEEKAMLFLKDKSEWILKHIWNLNNKNPTNTNLNINSRGHYLKYKEQARILCETKCKLWSEIMGLKYNRISIKSMKTKWGSCSSNKNLNFNYKTLFLNSEEQDYLIVHELSHLKHMNHSKDFWDLVCMTLWNEKFRRYKINKTP